MPRKLPPRVHRKKSKGLIYYYFATGRKNARGKQVLTRLPDYTSNGFGRAYAAAIAAQEGFAPEVMLTVPVLVKRFRESPEFRNKAQSTQSSYETYLRAIEDQLDAFPAEAVERQDVTKLRGKKAETPAAANQLVRTLSALYAWAIKEGLVKTNPAIGLDLYEGGEHKPWEDWLLAKALNADDANVRLATRLLYYTAQRIGDVRRMRWTDLQPDGTLYVKQEKTGTELWIPVHKELRDTLAAMPRGLTPIIARPDGKPFTTGTIRQWLQDFAAEHGAKIVPHGLRKNAVIALLEAGCTVAQAASISGQSFQLVEYYARLRDQRKLGKQAMAIWENVP